jgi:dihydroxyacetone kinase
MMLLLIVLSGKQKGLLMTFTLNVFCCRPRGLAGALLIIKMAGALAEQGKNMSEIVDICQKVRGQLRTIGLSASGIRAPGQQQAFEV